MCTLDTLLRAAMPMMPMEITFVFLIPTMPTHHRHKNPLLNLKDVTDSYGKTVPCVACLASGRSTVFTFPDNTVCPYGWTTEYVGYEAANPKWPGQNLCVDTYFGDKLSQTPCNNLAVIAKGPLNAYSYQPQDVVSCVVCSI